jgi:hypothetical protein
VDIKKVATTVNRGAPSHLSQLAAKKGKKKTRHQDEGIFRGSPLPNYGTLSSRFLDDCCRIVQALQKVKAMVEISVLPQGFPL